MAVISFEDATGFSPDQAPAPKAQKASAPTGGESQPTTFSHEEATGIPPESQRGPLSNAPDESALGTVGKYAGTAALKNLSHYPGFFGDTAQLGSMLENYGESVVTGRPYQDVSQGKERLYQQHPVSSEIITNPKAAYERGEYGNLLKYLDVSNILPSGQTFQDLLFKKAGLGEYKPTSGVGRIGMAGLEAATPGLGGKAATVEEAAGVIPRTVQAAKNYLTRNFAPQFAAGAAGSATGEITGDPLLAAGASMVAGHMGSTSGRAVEANRTPNRMGDLLAGHILRSASSSPGDAISAIESSSPNLFPGMSPTTVQLTRDPGLAALDSALFQDRSAPASPAGIQKNASNLVNDRNSTAFNQGASETISDLDPHLKDQYGLSTDINAHGVASTEARNIFNTLEEAEDKKVKDAWGQVPKVNVFRKKTLDPIFSAIDELGITHRKLLDPTALSVLEELNKSESPQIPLKELQNVRSQLLSAARDNAGSPAQVANNELAAAIKDAISKEDNISFGAYTDAVPRWREAVDATKRYHDIFNRGFLQGLTKETNGVPKIAMDATLDATLSGRNRIQNLDQLRSATNNAVDPAISDYLIAKLTGNGQKLITSRDIENEIAKNGAIYQKIPGAMDRLEQLQHLARRNEFVSALRNHVRPNGEVNANGIKSVIDQNRDLINEISSRNPVLADRLEKLDHSSSLMSGVEPATGPDLGPLADVQGGKTSNLMYSPSARRAATAAELGVAGLALHHGVDPAQAALMAAAFGVGPKAAGQFRESLLSGQVPDAVTKALHIARSNPAEAHRLMNLPDLEKAPSVLGPLGVLGNVGAQRGVQYNLENQPDYSNFLTSDEIDKLKKQSPDDIWSKLTRQESGNRQFEKNGSPIISPAGAVGAAQVMPKTGPEAAKYAGEDWDEKRLYNDEAYNRKLGRAYFDHLMQVFDDPRKALAAYNAGADRVQQAVRDAATSGKDFSEHLPKETRDYLRAIMGHATGGRIERASGGRIDSHVEQLANRLMRALADAKKATDATTEPLLNAPDEAIVKALGVANKAI